MSVVRLVRLIIVALLCAACTAPKPVPPPPIDGTDTGGWITLWARPAVEIQATLLVDAYNVTHSNQIRLTLVTSAVEVDVAAGRKSLPDLLAGDLADMPGWTGRGLYRDLGDRVTRLPFAIHLDPESTSGHTLPFVLNGQTRDAVGISRDSLKTEQAWNFLHWLLSADAQVHVLARNGDRVARSDLSVNEFSS